MRVEKPPGLNVKLAANDNSWSIFEKSDEEEGTTREKDMEDWANSYENDYPHGKNG